MMATVGKENGYGTFGKLYDGFFIQKPSDPALKNVKEWELIKSGFNFIIIL